MKKLKHKGSLYLSGGMEKAKDLGANWRLECSRNLRELGFNPLDITQLDKEYTKNYGELFHSFGAADVHLLQMKSNLRKHFVDTDLRLIKNDSDAIVLYYDESVRKGAGTISEAQYAYLNDIPLFIVNSYENMSELPGWLVAISTKVFNTFDELYKYLADLPDNILRRDVYGNHNSGDQYLCSLCGTYFKKHTHHFVSKISPLYCSPCVDVVQSTFEAHKDRYEFFIEQLNGEDTTNT